MVILTRVLFLDFRLCTVFVLKYRSLLVPYEIRSISVLWTRGAYGTSRVYGAHGTSTILTTIDYYDKCKTNRYQQ